MRLSNLNEDDIKLFFGDEEKTSHDNPEMVVEFEPEKVGIASEETIDKLKKTEIIPVNNKNEVTENEASKNAFFNSKPINQKDDQYNYYFSESHAKTSPKTRNSAAIYLMTALKFIGVFVVIFTISFVIVNFSAVSAKISYFWQNNVKKASKSTAYTAPKIIPIGENKLIIPKISVNAPIIWDVTDKDITKVLENGLAHYASTAKPGENGNTFITGHSSYYSWAKGDYKSVFVMLDKLSIDDDIYLHYRGASFHYKVKKNYVVKPDDLDVLANPKKNILTLMTCTPIGTDLYRQIVIAEQVF